MLARVAESRQGRQGCVHRGQGATRAQATSSARDGEARQQRYVWEAPNTSWP